MPLTNINENDPNSAPATIISTRKNTKEILNNKTQTPNTK